MNLLLGVFNQASEAHFRITKRALDHPEWMLNLGPDLSFRVFDFAAHATDQALFCVLHIAAGSRCDRPDHLPVLMMLRRLFHAGVPTTLCTKRLHIGVEFLIRNLQKNQPPDSF